MSRGRRRSGKAPRAPFQQAGQQGGPQRGPHGGQHGGAPAETPGHRRGRVWIVVIGLLVLGVFMVVRLRPFRSPGAPREAPRVSAGDRAMLDSLHAADTRRDWVNALLWAERLARAYPTDHKVLVARGTLWSNYAMDQRPGRLLPRPALRTSLERIACQHRAIALMDSSSRAAANAREWIDSGQRLADLYETLGLPGDALIANEVIKERQPSAMAAAMRAYWLRAIFYDPVDPDTSEYHESMKRQGLR